MPTLPNSIKKLMTSKAYTNSQDPDHKRVAAQIYSYFNDKYDQSKIDATGRAISVRKAWLCHAAGDDKTCAECAKFNNRVYENLEDVPLPPHHPNCRCWLEEIEIEDMNTPTTNTRFEKFNNATMNSEGGYVDNPNKIDQPTNTGITQPTLNQYKSAHPAFNFPDTVKELTPEQITQIYKDTYFDSRKIDEIQDDRIAYAIYDMGVMSNFKNVGKLVQNTLNETADTNLKVDGQIGPKTIRALNNLSDEEAEKFMDTLKENRIDYLQTLSTWPRYGRGWTRRTNNY